MIITRWIWIALGLLSCVAVILLHRQRALRRTRRVSSLFLWQLVYARLHAARRRRRLITNLILFAQLLSLLILSLALAGPHRLNPRPVVSLGIIVDTSQSMALTDPGTSRLEATVEALKEFLREGQATRYTLWTTTPPHLRLDTDSKDQLLAALDTLSSPQGKSDWDEVLRALPSRLSHDLSFHLILAGDGATDLAQADALAALSQLGNVHLMQVGTSIENMGITQMQVRPVGADPWAHQVLVEVSNFTDSPTDVALLITEQVPLIDLGLLSEPIVVVEQSLRVAPQETEVFVFEWTVTEGAVLRAALDRHDAFPFDDVVHVVARQPRPTRVLVIGEDNHFLMSALDVFDSLEVIYGDLGTWSSRGPFDLAIFNEVPVPPDFAGTAVHFAPAVATSDASARPANSIAWWQQEHPLFRFVDWNTVDVSSRSTLESDPAQQVLIQGVLGPLMVLDETETHRILRIGFSLNQSDLPYRIAFPIFLGNVLDWANPARASMTAPPDGLLSRDESNLSQRWLQSLEPLGARLLEPEATLQYLNGSPSLAGDGGQPPSRVQRPVAQPQLWQWAALATVLLILLEGFLYLGPRRSEARR